MLNPSHICIGSLQAERSAGYNCISIDYFDYGSPKWQPFISQYSRAVFNLSAHKSREWIVCEVTVFTAMESAWWVVYFLSLSLPVKDFPKYPAKETLFINTVPKSTPWTLKSIWEPINCFKTKIKISLLKSNLQSQFFQKVRREREREIPSSLLWKEF